MVSLTLIAEALLRGQSERPSAKSMSKRWNVPSNVLKLLCNVPSNMQLRGSTHQQAPTPELGFQPTPVRLYVPGSLTSETLEMPLRCVVYTSNSNPGASTAAQEVLDAHPTTYYLLLATYYALRTYH